MPGFRSMRLWIVLEIVRGNWRSTDRCSGKSTSDIRARVPAARGTAAQRWSEYGWGTNAEVSGPALRQKFRLSRAALAPVERVLREGVITARGGGPSVAGGKSN